MAQSLVDQLDVSPLLARCLVQRGLPDATAAREFLDPRLKRLADPFLLPNMEAAVRRLVRARESGEALVVFGDYDVDGVTSTALLTEFLRGLGWRVDFYLPHGWRKVTDSAPMAWLIAWRNFLSAASGRGLRIDRR